MSVELDNSRIRVRHRPESRQTPSNTDRAFGSKEDIRPHSRLSALAGRKDAMPKPAVIRRASRRQVTPGPVELPNVVEGQIAEICRDLAVEGKRIRQLQDQADELRTAIRQWASQSEVGSDRRSANRGGQR